MPCYFRTRSRVHNTQSGNKTPVQLSLPGIPEPVTPLPVRLWVTITNYRYPLTLAALVMFLYLIGQGFAAGAVVCGAGLYLISSGIDRHFAQALDQIQRTRGNRHG